MSGKSDIGTRAVISRGSTLLGSRTKLPQFENPLLTSWNSRAPFAVCVRPGFHYPRLANLATANSYFLLQRSYFIITYHNIAKLVCQLFGQLHRSIYIGTTLPSCCELPTSSRNTEAKMSFFRCFRQRIKHNAPRKYSSLIMPM